MSYQSTIKKLKAKNIDVRHLQKMLTSISQLGDYSEFTYKDVKQALKAIGKKEK